MIITMIVIIIGERRGRRLADVREDLQDMPIRFDKQMLIAILTFVCGTVGILIGQSHLYTRSIA
jgi:hypothetical protein